MRNTTSKISHLDLKYILNDFEDIEMYGGKDYLIDLYEKMGTNE